MNANHSKGQIEFPVNYVLKVFFRVPPKRERHLAGLEALLAEMNIPHREASVRKSREGRYIGVSVPVEVKDRPTYEGLYRRLQTLDGVKSAI